MPLVLHILGVLLLQNSFDTVDGDFENLLHLLWLFDLDILDALIKEFEEFGILGFHLHFLLWSTVSMTKNGNN